MMRTKRLITVILALSILLSVLAGITVSALELDEDVIIDDSSIEEELAPMAARGCDQYGSTTWGSLEEAKAKYGTDYKYTCTNQEFIGYNSDGTTYTYMRYYYTFSDGSKMYFGVVVS